MEREELVRLARACKEQSPERILLGRAYAHLSSEERRDLVTQVRLWPNLARKLPTWASREVYIPNALNLEQATSEALAELKACLLARGSSCLVDLTGGLGVDFVAMARVCSQAIYLEQSRELCEVAHYNFPQLLGEKVFHIYNGESLATLPLLVERYAPDLIYLDPARREEQRSGARRVYAIEDCSPRLSDICTYLERKRTQGYQPRVLVKLSPMLDIKHTLRAYPDVRAVYILAQRGEVKELLLEFDYREQDVLPLESIPIHSYDWRGERGIQHFSASYGEELGSPLQLALPERYVYEPSAGIMKMGLFRSFAARYELWGLHQHSHLYTSVELREDFPGRSFICREVIEASSSELRRLRKRISQAEITCRNYPLAPDALRKKLGIKAGGELTLMATTLADERHYILLLEHISSADRSPIGGIGKA